jgi:hypothetical protein
LNDISFWKTRIPRFASNEPLKIYIHPTFFREKPRERACLLIHEYIHHVNDNLCEKIKNGCPNPCALTISPMRSLQHESGLATSPATKASGFVGGPVAVSAGRIMVEHREELQK